MRPNYYGCGLHAHGNLCGWLRRLPKPAIRAFIAVATLPVFLLTVFVEGIGWACKDARENLLTVRHGFYEDNNLLRENHSRVSAQSAFLYERRYPLNDWYYD